MKIFWPHRSKANGFSIQTLAFKYREKITRLPAYKISNQLLADTNLKPNSEGVNHLEVSPQLKIRGHWANRDFSEYRDVA